MTNEQARELQGHLIQEFNRNGYGDLVQDTLLYLEEQLEEDLDLTPRNYLLFFLNQMIASIENISNDNYGKLLDQFNAYVGYNEQHIIETLNVELDGYAGEPFDLRYLPSYTPLINGLRRLHEQLASSDNDN